MYFFVKETDNNFRYLYASPMMGQIFKRDYEEIAGKTDFDLFADPEVASSFREMDKEVVRTGKMHRFIEKMVDPDGILRSIDTIKLLIPRKDKAPYLLGMSWDITEQTKIEEKLRNAHNELAQACKAGLIYPYTWDIESKTATFTLVKNNQIYYKSVTNENFCASIHPNDLDTYKKAREAFASGKTKNLRTSFRSTFFSEQYVWYEMTSGSYKTNKDGRNTNAMGVIKDISVEKQNEKDLRNQNRKLALCCQAGKIYPWTWDLINDTAEISIVIKGEIRQISLIHSDFLKTVHPDDYQMYKDITKELISGHVETMKFNFRSNYFGKDYIWFEKIGEVSEYNEKGMPAKSMGILRDITADKLQEADRQAKLFAEESDRMKSAFIANMSHEIRTPLNAIVGFSSLLAEGENNEEKKEYLKIIENNNDFLLQLINDILDISKIEAGKMEFTYTPFCLNEVFFTQEQTFALRAKPGVKILFENNEHDYSIVSEKTRFTQVIANFLSNAIKFTTSGYVRFGYNILENGIYCYVSDTGSGHREMQITNNIRPFCKIRHVYTRNRIRPIDL